MKRFTWVTAVFVLVSLMRVGTIPADGGKKSPTVKEIMGKLNKGPTALTPALGKALKAAEPDWEKILEQTKTYIEQVGDLAKNDAPKGTKESWEKLTKAYAENAKALNEAAKKKDVQAAKTAQAKLAGSCRVCHMAHRPNS
jgi:cytochrome c556